MNEDEKIAESFLNKNYNNIVYEPDGNIPPDFSQNGSATGIEVRRLNQRYREDNQMRGLEQDSISLIKSINSILENIPITNNKYWLQVKYKRPLGNNKDVKKGLNNFITAFEKNGENYPFEQMVASNVFIKVIAKANNTAQKYSLGGFIDRDSGGWVVDMYIQEIKECMDEKEKKINPYISKYSQWWLILVDHLGCMSPYDIEKTKNGLVKNSCWQKVIVIDVNSNLVLEI